MWSRLEGKFLSEYGNVIFAVLNVGESKITSERLKLKVLRQSGGNRQ